MPTSTKKRTTRKACPFTLIELLVVISIIALLAGLLLPALSQAREKGHRTACLGHQRQLMFAIHLYCDANGEFLPFPNHGAFDGLGPGWLYRSPNMSQPQDVEAGQLWPYLQNRTVYWCPMDKPPYTMAGGAPRPQQLSSYCINAAIDGTGRLGYLTYKIGLFRPDAVCFWETSEQGGYGYWCDGTNEAWETVTLRHGGGGTIGCFDGHVEWLTRTSFNLEVQNQPGRLWCNPGTPDGT